MFALVILWTLQVLEEKLIQKFKQKILGIETKLNANTKNILDQIDQEKIAFLGFNVDKPESGFFIQLKLESFGAEKIKGLIQRLQQNADINRIFWE